MPRISSVDAATQAANDLITALQKPSPALPHLDLSTDHTKTLKKLATISNNATAKLDKNNNEITLIAPSRLKYNLQQKQQPDSAKDPPTTSNTMGKNTNDHHHIILPDHEIENYNMTRESLTPMASDFHRNRFPRKAKNINIIPNDVQNTNTPKNNIKNNKNQLPRPR